ncbi:PepSY domain-containing protein [Aquimarina brevivitae]|uniref:PepSY-associated transmembrane protein n=1 Tax=Aquimarina brevivitae TaxID=323412 RepID=A0A4Q7PIZ3_9FLAO|nr:PepSY domain-containing protein [Aquimarina brevivitae]RZS99800.1 PepSY-associated transmembrane protein [Aquimarina brevivitae]
MVNRHTARKIRKAHRYLGLFLGVQFLMWTISGIYFSWSDIDEIHGDHFKKVQKPITHKLSEPNSVLANYTISSLNLHTIADQPYYWINDSILVHAYTGVEKSLITEQEAKAVAKRHIIDGLNIKTIKRIDAVGNYHEYRGRPLPAYAITYDHPDRLVAYVSAKDGLFQRVRHQSWRWFDFLWMTHTMDYQGRDDFNTLLLRVFSALGLITVLSGFLLWFISSRRMIKIVKKNRK